jgi:hypothetical protein
MLSQLESQIETALKPREPKCTNFMEEYLKYTNSNIEKLTGIDLNLRKLIQRTSQTIEYGYKAIKEKEREVNDVEHEMDERTQRINFLIAEKEILTSQSEAEKMTLIEKHNAELAQQKTNYEELLATVEKLDSINLQLKVTNSYDLTAKVRLEDEKIALKKEYEEKLAAKANPVEETPVVETPVVEAAVEASEPEAVVEVVEAEAAVVETEAVVETPAEEEAK